MMSGGESCLEKDNCPRGDEHAHLTVNDATVGNGSIGEDARALGPEAEEHNASVSTTVINILTNVVGGGILALPTALHDGTFVFGLVLLVLVATMASFSAYLLVLCADLTKNYTYKGLIQHTFGVRASYCFEFILCIYPFGFLIMYSKIVASSMPPVMKDFFHAKGLWLDDVTWLCIGAVVFFGLSCRRYMRELKWSSVMGFLTMAYVAAVIAVRFFMGTYRLPDQSTIVSRDINWVRISATIFQAFPILSVAYTCHYNIPVYYMELGDRSPAKFRRVLSFAIPAITTIYLVVAVFGILTFGNDRVAAKKGNILECYASDDIPFNIGRVGMFFHFCGVFPILLVAVRRALNNLVFGHQNQSMRTLVAESLCLVVVACIIGHFVPGISVIIEFDGALFGVFITFIVPSCLFLANFDQSALSGEKSRLVQQSGYGDMTALSKAQRAAIFVRSIPQQSRLWKGTLALLIGGVGLAICGITMVIYKQAS